MKKAYPVVFFVYKRPKTTRKFLDLVAAAGTSKLYIFADGPRNNSEKSETDQVKSSITQFSVIHPNIEVITHYAHRNLGLRENIVRGLSHVFSQEGAAIIIEDDCLPSPDFFRFCTLMLSRYESDQRIMSVTGTSIGKFGKYDYDFSRYQQCWGWATWARAWKLYDPAMYNIDNRQTWNKLAKDLWPDWLSRWYWTTILEFTRYGWIDTWDYQWSFAHFWHHSLAIVPSTNLINNIGFDDAATNTKFKNSAANLKVGVLSVDLKIPPIVTENMKLTHHLEKTFYKNIIAFAGLFKTWLKHRIISHEN